MLVGHGLEGLCNYGSCLHGEKGDRGTDMKQGCIQPGQVRNDRRYVRNSCRAIKEDLACNMDKDRMKIRVGTLRSQGH